MTERVSVCCGAPELLPGMCAACHEHTSFETEGGCCSDNPGANAGCCPDTLARADAARTWFDVGLAAERGATS